ncbi:MAG: CDP-alcohol phosphatidyltransferase family protein [Thermoprotei archaeon]|nr:MAG: CDP-alcohol phosphatidyltransferase family protein [Thermoprotei archaeon]
MLSRFRSRLSLVINWPSRLLAKAGVSPSLLTTLSLLLSSLAALSAYVELKTMVPLLMVFAGYCDALDGAVARLLKASTRFGAFLDSFCDRISDSAMILTLMFLGLEPLPAYLLLTTSFIISYSRARAEALGVKVEGVGLAERAERVLILVLAALFYVLDLKVGMIEFGDVLSYMLLLLTTVTVIQRFIHIKRCLMELT